jgi:hypothetical protein
MEFLDLARAVDEAICVVPGVVWIIAFPFCFVLKYATSDFTGEDTRDVVFRLSVYLGWGR